MAAKKKNWLLYGANGYSGELIARRAVERGQNLSLQEGLNRRFVHLQKN